MYKSKGSGSASDANRDEFDDWTKMEDKKRASTDQVPIFICEQNLFKKNKIEIFK